MCRPVGMISRAARYECGFGPSSGQALVRAEYSGPRLAEGWTVWLDVCRTFMECLQHACRKHGACLLQLLWCRGAGRSSSCRGLGHELVLLGEDAHGA